MFPYSPQAHGKLLKIEFQKDELGITKTIIKESKNFVGMLYSITTSEYQAAVQTSITFDFKLVIQSFLYSNQKYVEMKGEYYKVNRTFITGQFIELYLSKIEIDKGEIEYA